MLNVQSIRENLLNVTYFNSEIIELIATNNWLNIWVPKQYNGLGLTISEGLKILQTVSKIDGSLGWFVTLCSGANYFSRNLYPSVAFEIFSNQKACFGGSGMIGGTAEKVKKALMQNLLSGKLKPDGSARTEEEFYIDEKFGKVPIGWIYDKVKNSK